MVKKVERGPRNAPACAKMLGLTTHDPIFMQPSEPLSFIDPSVLASASSYAERFQAAQPFRHIVIDDFLRDEFCADLLDAFPAFDRQGALAEHGAVGLKSVREHLPELGPPYAALDQLVSSDPFLRLIGHITGIDDLRYDPCYFGGGTHENLHGQDLSPHIDFNYHPKTRQHRRLNLLLYLNREWHSEWGGCIDFHADPHLPPEQDQVTSILPLFNRCVIFETNEYSWHGFTEIQLPENRREESRKSVALYYYTDERPARETAGRHSTVYVERGLPSDIQPGTRLTEEDHRRITRLMARRDQHIQMLYGEIAQLYAQLDGDESVQERLRAMEHSKSWRLTAPLRAFRRRVLGEPSE